MFCVVLHLSTHFCTCLLIILHSILLIACICLFSILLRVLGLSVCLQQVWPHGGQRCRIQAVVMSYLRGACGLYRMDGESNQIVYGKFGMSVQGEGMNCGVVKYSICRWFGHLKRMGGDEMPEDLQVRWMLWVWGQSVGILKGERRGMESAKVQCMDRRKWSLFCHSHRIEGVPSNRRQSKLH